MLRPGDYMTATQAAEDRQADKSSILRAILSGRMRAVRCGHVWLIPRSEVTKYEPRRLRPRAALVSELS